MKGSRFATSPLEVAGTTPSGRSRQFLGAVYAYVALGTGVGGACAILHNSTAVKLQCLFLTASCFRSHLTMGAMQRMWYN